MEFIVNNWESLGLCGSLLLVSGGIINLLINGLSKGYLNEKFKHIATIKNFNSLKEQLEANTFIVENIKTKFFEKTWITQQVWVKKQEAYESILINLFKLKKHVEYRLDKKSSFLEAFFYFPDDPFVLQHLYENDHDKKEAIAFQEHVEENQSAYKAKFESLSAIERANLKEKTYKNKMEDIVEMIDIKSIYLTDNIHEINLSISEIITDVFKKEKYQEEHQGPEEHVEELSEIDSNLIERIQKIIDKVKQLSKKELQLF